MSTPAFEAFLVRLYVDEAARARFLADPYSEAARARLTPAQSEALRRIDTVGLALAAESFAHKRRTREETPRHRAAWRSWMARLAAFIGQRRAQARSLGSRVGSRGRRT